MTSVDADLRTGRRLETGRRSESIIYNHMWSKSYIHIFFNIQPEVTYLRANKDRISMTSPDRSSQATPTRSWSVDRSIETLNNS
jgi:hypothetical protein